VLLGGPPCQGFSLAGKRRVDDPRNELFRDYMRVLDVLRPKVAILENVRLLTSMKSKSGRLVKDEIAEQFRNHGYRVRLFEENAKNYGVPQHRERVIFVAVKGELGKDPSFPKPEFVDRPTLYERRVRTFADACSDLAFIESGEAADDPLHTAVSHPDHVVEWLWDVPEGRSAHDNEDPVKRPPSGYNTTYKRQIWNEPAGTVQTTFGMISGCRNVHPIATRALTVREAARIQSFPDTYRFVGSLAAIRTGIGNAVPPLLGRSIAQHVRSRILDLVEVSGL
jgi:DNA (cytosine-5)-methyltransferase 1